MDTLLRNFRYGLRTLARSPGFTVTVVLTLAVAIGVNSAVFSAIDAVLLKSLPFPAADRLVSVEQLEEGATSGGIAPVRLEDWNERNSTFEAITGYAADNVSETSAAEPEFVRRATVAPRFNDVWGIAPALGRALTAADHQVGAPPVVLISDRWWQRRFEADPDVLGKTVRIGIGDLSYTIVGVMPPTFRFPERDVDLWVARIHTPFVLSRTNEWYNGFGRLKPGVSLEQARADLARVQAQLAEQYPDTDDEISVRVDTLDEATVGDVRGSLWLLFGAVSVLLLIACTNIAALLLSRGTRRQQEVSVRLMLGSSQWSVAGQMLTEVAILAVAGALLGLGIAAAAPRALLALAPDFPRIEEVAVDGRIVMYTLAVVLAVTILCGLVPAIRSARAPVREASAEGGRTQVSARHSAQWLLVGVQVALSVTLLAGAGLLVRSFQELWRVERGFESAQVLTFRVSGSLAEPRPNVPQRVENMVAELATLPSVEAVAASSPVPGVLNDRTGFEFVTNEFELVGGEQDPELRIFAENRIVSPTYFDVMQIPLAAGERCRRPQEGATEIMVNRAFEARYFAGRSPLGRELRGASGSVARITGIVGDAREYGLDRAPVPTVYSCTTAITYPPLAFLVRTGGDPMALVETVRRKLNEIEPLRSMYDIAPLEDRIGDAYAQNRLRTLLLALFAGTALSLTCLGVYGTLSYIANLRRREVGLRVALGALQRAIVVQFLVKALRVVGAACGAGLLLALAFGQALSGMLYGVSASDPFTLAAVVLLVVGVAALAAWLPAWRASRIDPMQALREE
jgi:putative ABC transport system permease protein